MEVPYMKYILGLIFGYFTLTNGQLFNIGCPSGWLIQGSTCYKFVHDEFLVYEEADAACNSYGATLLSVNTGTEHQFVSEWLTKNNAMTQTQWFTSGYYDKNIVVWESENTIHPGPFYWIRQPRFDEPVHRIAYAFGGSNFIGYGWVNISASTPANYICELPRSAALNLNILQRDFEYGVDVSDPTRVKRGPHITEQPKSLVIIDGALPLELECAASGNPYPVYTWWAGQSYQNKTEVNSAVNDRYTLSGGQFSIENPSSEDIGSYYCKAENEIGSVYSSQAKLIYGFLKFFQNIDPEPVYATPFKGTKMDCNAPAHSPEVTYEWFKNFATNIFVWPNNPNMFVSRAGFLYVSEVQPTDANKRYYCTVTLIPSEGMVMSRAFAPSRTNLGLLLLLSSESASDNDYGPIINTHAFPSPALMGRTIYMECIAYGTHPLYYSWRREDGRPFVKGTRITARSRVLTIPNAPLEAEGNYICTCLRGSGVSAEKTISIFMEAKPYFPYPIKNIFADPGMRVDWHCKAVARPAATYAWYKNGKLLQTVPGQMEVKGHVLTILSVDKSRDEGMYQCGATNQHGTTFSSGQLTVLSLKPNFNRNPIPPVFLAPVGGNVTIPCGVEAAPVPQVRWLKNGGDLGVMQGDTSGRLGMDTQYGLVITDVSYTDQGVYTCHASNTLGEASNVTTVRVIEGIQIITPPAPVSVLVNRTAFMFCQASYNSRSYDLAYIWKFNGRPINYHINPEFIAGSQQSREGLYITNAQYKHAGLYECTARTTLHSVTRGAVLTVRGPPGPPSGVYADDETITTRSVRIVWTVGQEIDHGGPIVSYDIEAETNYHPGIWQIVASDVVDFVANNEAVTSGKRPDQRAITLQSLIPNTSYRFRVRAVNEYGRGSEASKPSIAVKIAQTAPIIAPRNVGGGGGSVGTLTIAWEPLDISEHCGPGLGYFVYWKRVGSEKDWIREAGTDEKAMKHGTFTVTVGPENYYLEYLVKVGAYNQNGMGPNSTEQVIYSAEGMPNSVPILKDTETFNSTSIIINWEPVPDNRETMKGRVKGYRISYYVKIFDETPFEKEPDPVKNNIIVKDVYGQTDHAQLIGLVPYSEYFARVQVFNSAGAGPKGEWRWAETANMPLRRFPTHVEVHPHGEHSVLVKWRGVSINPDEESLTGYILRVWKIQEDIRTATDTRVDKVMEAVIDGLQVHTVYELRLLGYSRAGDGALSEAVYFTVMGGNIPFDPTTSKICYKDSIAATCGVDTLQLSPLVAVTLLFLTMLMAKYY